MMMPILVLLLFIQIFSFGNSETEMETAEKAPLYPFVICHVECTNKCHHQIFSNVECENDECQLQPLPRVLLHICDHFCCDRFPGFSKFGAPCPQIKVDRGLLGQLKSIKNGSIVAIFTGANEKFVSLRRQRLSGFSNEIDGQFGEFELHKTGKEGIYWLKSRWNGKWVMADVANGGILMAKGNRPRGWEEFQINVHQRECGPFYTLRSIKNGKFVTVDKEREGILVANKQRADTDLEKFYIKILH